MAFAMICSGLIAIALVIAVIVIAWVTDVPPIHDPADNEYIHHHLRRRQQ